MGTKKMNLKRAIRVDGFIKVLKVSIAAICLWTAAPATAATIAGDYPARSIRVLDQYGAGGATDVMSRSIGQKFAERFGQTIVVDNRPGVAGNLAADLAAKAPADGYVLLMAVVSDLATSPLLYPHMGIQPLRDFAFVTTAASGSYAIVVTPTFRAKTIPALIDAAKKEANKISYGSGGIGSQLHLAGELLNSRAGIQMLHVPYKGGAGAIMTATASGEIQVGISSIAGSLPFVTTGRVTPIAVTSAKRAKLYPNVPTVAEAGIAGYDITPWYGLVAPAATSAAIVNGLSVEIGKILQLPEVQSTFATLGLEATPNTPGRFREIMQADIATATKIIKDAGIQAPQ
jgi:tripartite-type tricarboxylate transporter receptor subunit TctC